MNGFLRSSAFRPFSSTIWKSTNNVAYPTIPEGQQPGSVMECDYTVTFTDDESRFKDIFINELL